MMLLEAVDRRLIVIVLSDLLGKALKVERLYLEVKLRAHQFVAIALVAEGEFYLI